MSHRRLVFVTVLALGDYALWSWSLNGSHEVLELVAGLTLPPLALVCVGMLAVALTRAIGRTLLRPRALRARRRKAEERSRTAAAAADEALASARASDARSRKLAA